MRNHIIVGCLIATVMACTGLVNAARAEESDIPLDKLPKVVVDAVKKMFPKAELIKATKEEEDEETTYEVTIKEGGKKMDVTVEEDGEIEEIEKEIDLKELPKVVTEAIAKKHPKATLQTAEAVYEIEDGKEELEYYEVQIKTADNKEIEVKVKADGNIVDSESKTNA